MEISHASQILTNNCQILVLSLLSNYYCNSDKNGRNVALCSVHRCRGGLLGRAENFSRICHAIYVNAMMTVPPTIRFMLSLLFYRVSYIALIYYVTFFEVLEEIKLKFSSLLKSLGTIILNVIILEKVVAFKVYKSNMGHPATTIINIWFRFCHLTFLRE